MKISKSLTVLLLLSTSACETVATSISQYVFTWTFNEDRSVEAGTMGQYANGDWWVVGPVTITAISPASTDIDGRVMNGSMVNPVARPFAANGFDSTLTFYDPDQNVARPGGMDLSASNPLVLPAGSSLISGKSILAPANRPQLSDAAVLTVVATAPPEGAFRPPYCGTDKTHYWNKSQLNFGILKSLEPVASTPSLATVTNYFRRAWIEVDTQHSGREWHPSNNQPMYGRDMANQVGTAILSLQLNYTEEAKAPLLTGMVQYGIDIFGAAETGTTWAANGGHNHGRKMPLILAGLALGDARILAYGDQAQHFIFQEDLQTWYVTEDDVGREVHNQTDLDPPRIRETYREEHVGLPEWGITHWANPYDDGSNWGVIYRNVVFGSSLGMALGAHLTAGAYETWNWPVYFDYMDRVWSIESGGSEFSNFHKNMWAAYRYSGGTQVLAPLFTPGGGPYSGSQEVSIATNTPGASIRYTTDGSSPARDHGESYAGPVSISETTTLKAMAFADGLDDSPVTTAIYVIQGSDTQPPSVPAGLAAFNITAYSVDVSWNPSTDDFVVAGYRVYLNGAEALFAATSPARLAGLTADTSYTVTISAVDANGNESQQSGPLLVTTEPPDSVPPTSPTGLSVTGVGHSSVDLSWSASTDNTAVAGYRIHIAGVGSVDVGDTLSATLTNLSPETHYIFTVSAYDELLNESGPGAAVQVTTSPAPVVLETITVTGLRAQGDLESVYYGSEDATAAAVVTPSTVAAGYTNENSQTMHFSIGGLTVDAGGTGDDTVEFSIVIEAWGVTASVEGPTMTLDQPYIFSTNNTYYWGNTGLSGGGNFDASTTVAAGEGLSFRFVEDSGIVHLGGLPSAVHSVILDGFTSIAYDNRNPGAQVVLNRDNTSFSLIENPDVDSTINLSGGPEYPDFIAIGEVNGTEGRFRLARLGFRVQVAAESTQPPFTWRGVVRDGEGFMDTGHPFGLVYAGLYPWMLSEEWDRWFFATAADGESPGYWIYLPL